MFAVESASENSGRVTAPFSSINSARFSRGDSATATRLSSRDVNSDIGGNLSDGLIYNPTALHFSAVLLSRKTVGAIFAFTASLSRFSSREDRANFIIRDARFAR